jgi:hypothetical protein
MKQMVAIEPTAMESSGAPKTAKIKLTKNPMVRHLTTFKTTKSIRETLALYHFLENLNGTHNRGKITTIDHKEIIHKIIGTAKI